METTSIKTIKFSKEDITKILSDYLYDKGIIAINDKFNFRFNIARDYEGYGKDEQEIHYLKNIECTITKIII